MLLVYRVHQNVNIVLVVITVLLKESLHHLSFALRATSVYLEQPVPSLIKAVMAAFAQQAFIVLRAQVIPSLVL